MKALILSGSPGTALLPLANYYPKHLLPVANEPLIKYLLNSLQKSPITEVAIILSKDQDSGESVINEFIAKEDRLRVSYYYENKVRGTAGSLKKLEGFIGSSPFLVISSNIFIKNLNIAKILNFHLTHGAGITMVVEQSNRTWEELENIEVSKHGVVSKIHILHHSRNNRQIIRPTGIYVFNPAILSHICEEGHMDIKEQLIPDLHSKGIPVYAYKLEGAIKRVDSFADYLQLNGEILLDDISIKNEVVNTKTEIMDRIWVGNNVKISPKAYLLGPIVIGDDCIIGDYSNIIGPASIGAGTCIEKDVLVRESIIWKETHLMNRARIEYSLITEACVISMGQTIKNSVMMNNRRFPGSFDVLSLNYDLGYKVINDDTGVLKSIYNRTVKHKIFLAVKIAIDFIFSSLGLLIFLPMFIIIPAAIKIDSSGPVFFCQKRCGKEGKEFKMYKFRTMFKDADETHKKLVERKDIDGPMFKMKDDPRITKVGRFLRKTSLDEIPQFFNVLKGEMSLVGPRPLIMDEMKFSPSWRDLRLKVKPGITGLWQVSGRGDVSFHDWIKCDIDYVKNQSIWLDIMVIVKTIYFVIGRKGAH